MLVHFLHFNSDKSISTHIIKIYEIILEISFPKFVKPT